MPVYSTHDLYAFFFFGVSGLLVRETLSECPFHQLFNNDEVFFRFIRIVESFNDKVPFLRLVSNLNSFSRHFTYYYFFSNWCVCLFFQFFN